MKINVMFVCLGNICRSPLGEALLANKVKIQNLESFIYIESSGTAAHHVGEKPDPRTIAVAKKHQVPIAHRAQQLKASHFETFDYMLVMDESNADNAVQIQPKNAVVTMVKMRDFDSEDTGSDVADPWFGDEAGFEICYQTLDRCTDAFLHFLVKKHNLKPS
jgi:protein-tyrosine-phosphatase